MLKGIWKLKWLILAGVGMAIIQMYFSWMWAAIGVLLFIQIVDWIFNYKSHKEISRLFFNHKDAINSLNKLTKSLEKSLDSALSDIKALKKDSDAYKKDIASIKETLLDPKMNLEKFKTNQAFENAKKMLQIQRTEAREEQKRRKDQLRQNTKSSKS